MMKLMKKLMMNIISDEINYGEIELLGDCIENTGHGENVSNHLNSINVNITIKKGEYPHE